MADGQNNNNNNASSETSEKGKQEESKLVWRKDVEGLGKFDTPEAAAKAYKDLESKLGEQAKEIGQTREFAQVVKPLLDEIRADPEIFARLDERLRKKTDPDGKDTKKEEKADAKVQTDDIRTVASDILIERFEERKGLNKLSTEDRKELRKEIGNQVFEMTGQDIASVDLRRLNGVLDKAFTLAIQGNEKLADKFKSGKDDSDEAGIPGFPSSKGKSEENLTSEEADVASKLGLTRQQYLAGKTKK